MDRSATVCVAAHSRGRHPDSTHSAIAISPAPTAVSTRAPVAPPEAGHRLDDRQVPRRAAEQLVVETVHQPDRGDEP